MQVKFNNLFRPDVAIWDKSGNSAKIISNNYSPLWPYKIKYDNGGIAYKTESEMEEFSLTNKSNNFKKIYDILNDKAA